jgi:hypothetical protein
MIGRSHREEAQPSGRRLSFFGFSLGGDPATIKIGNAAGGRVMRYLIDGYNLLHAMGLLSGKVGPHGLEKARLDLMDRLCETHGDSAAAVTVVFDAAKAPPGADAETEYRGIHIRYALDGEADDVIETLIQHEPAPRRLPGARLFGLLGRIAAIAPARTRTSRSARQAGDNIERGSPALDARVRRSRRRSEMARGVGAGVPRRAIVNPFSGLFERVRPLKRSRDP